jgi:hypothetical protein
MVFTRPVQRGWSRRAVLGMLGLAAGIGPVAACSWREPDPPPPPPLDPLEPLLASARELAGQYERAITDHPDLAGRLGPLREAHLAHEEALRAVIGRPELASASPGTASWVTPPADHSTIPPARSPKEAVAALRNAERDGREQAAQACLAAEPDRAALLGSITAARRTHVAVLS